MRPRARPSPHRTPHRRPPPPTGSKARPLNTLGLTALTALVTMALLGTPPAMAQSTTLCKVDESVCEKGNQVSHVHETTLSKSKATLLSNLGNIACDALFLGDTSGGSSGNPLLIKGNFTYTSCELNSTEKCTVTEVSAASLIEVLKQSHETAKVTGEGEVKVKCGLLIDCTFNGEGLAGTAKGPLLSSETNGSVLLDEQEMHKTAGILCPITAKLDITTTPLSATYIAGEAPPTPPTKEEQFGGGNPVAPNIIVPCIGDPINCATGNLTEEQTDIPTLGGRGSALAVTRSYNSQLAASQKEPEVGPFGYGWTGPYSASLSFNAKAETATVRQDNGATAVFYKVEGKYTPPKWDLASLKESGKNWIFTLPTQEALEFNESGQLVKVTDRHKLSLTLTYKEGKLETVEDAAKRKLTFTYKEGKVESIKDPLGNTVKYAYDLFGNLAKVTLPGEEKANWEFKYDISHRLTKLTDGRGNTTSDEYSAKDRVTLQTDPLEGKRKLEYKEAEGIVTETTITEPNGSKTLEKFNEAGEPTEITKASGTELAQTTKYAYTIPFELEKLTDANGHVTKYGYDSEGNRTSEVDGNENETKWAYNSTHDLTSETTPKGEKTTITRNSSGDPETIKRPAPSEKTQETKFKWAENGDLEEETNPLGHKTTFGYDKYGNREAETNAEGDKRTWKYDEDGRVTSEVSPRGNEEGAKASEFETKTKRDAQGRPEVITDPLGNETKYKYDAAGNLEVVTNPNGHATTYVYDKADRPTEVKAANGDVTKTAYDSMGQVKSRTDGNGNTTKYERNSLEQITEVIDPLERKATREYDAAGSLKKTKDPEGRTVTYTYDAGDRLTKVDYSEEATKDITFKYGKDDEVTEMTDGTGTTKKTYDELDRLTEVENGAKEVVKYKYDLGNEITEIVYPNGKSVTRSFDKAGRLTAVKDWLGGETKLAYNRNSLPKTTTFPSESENKDEYEYNNADELTKTTLKKSSETLASISYARDSAGQLKSATQSGLPGSEKVEYEYDERERLKKGAGTSFAYDAANNPTKLGSSSLKYDKASQLEEAGTTKYAFDKLGERTKATPEKGPATTYGYDQAGNLISVTRKEEGEVKEIKDTYAYDGNGLRASQTISGTKASMAWDVSGGLPLLLSDGTNYYVYGSEGLPIEQIAEETPTYLHHDHLGSTRMLTNSKGEAKGKYTYTPYGEIEEHTGTASTPLGFNGQYRNESTGLIYLRARVYDPVTAQFMSVDPLVAQTGELYGYAGGDPVNGRDPSGLCGEQQGPGASSMPPRFGHHEVQFVVTPWEFRTRWDRIRRRRTFFPQQVFTRTIDFRTIPTHQWMQVAPGVWRLRIGGLGFVGDPRNNVVRPIEGYIEWRAPSPPPSRPPTAPPTGGWRPA